VIVKADVQGSLTSVIDSIKSFDTDEVSVRVVGSGVGVVTENDIHMALTTGAVIYGFHVDVPNAVKQLSMRDKITIRQYKVIYELLDDVKSELSARLAPEIIETEQGRLVVKGVFKTTRTEVIAGGEVTKGTLVVPSLARVKRDGEVITEDLEVVALKQGPQETKEVQTGEMCGMSIKTQDKLVVQEGDHIELYTRQTKERSL
jgi:translation initiation factor IF-2